MTQEPRVFISLEGETGQQLVVKGPLHLLSRLLETMTARQPEPVIEPTVEPKPCGEADDDAKD